MLGFFLVIFVCPIVFSKRKCFLFSLWLKQGWPTRSSSDCVFTLLEDACSAWFSLVTGIFSSLHSPFEVSQELWIIGSIWNIYSVNARVKSFLMKLLFPYLFVKPTYGDCFLPWSTCRQKQTVEKLKMYSFKLKFTNKMSTFRTLTVEYLDVIGQSFLKGTSAFCHCFLFVSFFS